MPSASPTPCASCAAPLAGDQRYCLECGARHGAPRLDPLAHARGTAFPPPAIAASGAPTPAYQGPMAIPGPRVAGLLTLGMILAGFALGTAGSPNSSAATALARRVVVANGAPALGALPAPAPAPASEPGLPPADGALPEAPAMDAQVDEGLAAEPALPLTDTPLEPDVAPLEEESGPPLESTPIPKAAAKLPPITNVWVITLADRGLGTTFGPDSPDRYVREELVREGVLLNNFHATATGTPANGVALLSGQGANTATDGDCAQPTVVTPGTVAAEATLQQVEGDGCVYPSTVATLPEQLTSAGKSWKAYVEDVAPGRLSTAPNCEAARSPRNPFASFLALTDAPDCPERIVGIGALAGDLAEAAKTPSLSWIVPDACHDGRDVPCAPDAPAGLPAASAWLRPVLDQIRATDAYKQGGLIVLLADRAPMDGALPDTSARKGAPKGRGGGLVPALLLSPFVTPGQQVAAAYDHFSLLATLEDLFELPRLGQAARPGLRTFGPRVFGAFAAPEE